MASNAGVDIRDTWKRILQVGDDNTGLTASFQIVRDGADNETVLGLSTTAVQISGYTVTVTGTTSISGTNTGDQTLTSLGVTAAAQTVLDDTTVAAMVDTLGGATSTGTGGLARATSPTFVTPILGTPTSGTLTNCTGLPISTGVSGLAAGVATFLATPSSANLISAVTNETGTGSLVFATSPTLVTPVLGTPASGNLSNCTNIPAGGSTTQLQYNNAGVAGGVSGWTTNGSTTLAGVGQFDIDNLRMDGNTLSTTDANGNLTVAPNGTGQVLMPGQSAFSASLSATATDQTGDGTLYTIIANTEAFDKAGDYNTSTGTFVTRAAGVHIFGGLVFIGGLTASHTDLIIELSGAGVAGYVYYIGNSGAARTSANQLAIPFVAMGTLNAGVSVNLKITVSGGTKVIDIISGAGNTYWWGRFLG